MKLPLLTAITALVSGPVHAALIAGWDLDESSGNVFDLTANHPEGVHVGTGGAPDYAQPGVPNGSYGSVTVSAAGGSSMGFGPSIEDDFFVLGADNNNPIMNIDRTGSFTAMGWVNPNSPDAARTFRFLSTGSSLGGDRGWGLGLRFGAAGATTASIRFTTYGVADNDSATFLVTHGQWLHMAVTYNNGAISYFLNGDPLDTDTSLFGNDGIAARLVIGGRLGANDSDQMNGLVDGIRVFDSILNLDDIRTAAAGSVSIPEPSAAIFALLAAGACFTRRRRD